MTVLVTGGSGLVGSHVIEALIARGTPVRALALPGSAATVEALGAVAVPGDVTDAATWRRAAAGVRGIVHAAALVQQRVPFDRYVAVNVGGTRCAVEAARAEGARLVHISSVSVYGGTSAYRPGEVERRTEDYPFSPIPEADFYARSKRMAEELLRETAERGGVTALALRPNVIYGERDRLFTPRLIRVVRLGVVPALGPGTNHLSAVYAGNVAAATVAALDASVSGFRAYNVTADRPPALTEREFIAAFGEAMGRPVRRVQLPRAVLLFLGMVQGGPRLARAAVSFLTGENPYVSDRARVELGWEPQVTTRDGVRRSVRWFGTSR